MYTQEAVALATQKLTSLNGHIFDLVSLSKPNSVAAAANLSRIISKLSPLLGNMIEFEVVEYLNSISTFQKLGKWKRQDPGFPDTVFDGSILPAPGFEIKAWMPLATEITARFKESQNHFPNDETYVAMLAWLPTHIIFGRPRVLGVCVVSAHSLAVARDCHYHNPPDYIVLEPEDTTARTKNLQQTNTNGYKFQGTPAEFERARHIVEGWGPDGTIYLPSREYQTRLRKLQSQIPSYRLDTNFAKLDRIAHPEIEDFKEKILTITIEGRPIREWARLLSSDDETKVYGAIQNLLKKD